jgi:hypothetical protein
MIHLLCLLGGTAGGPPFTSKLKRKNQTSSKWQRNNFDKQIPQTG